MIAGIVSGTPLSTFIESASMRNNLFSTLRRHLLVVVASMALPLYAQAQEVDEQPNVEIKKFKNWSVQCVSGEEEPAKVCVMFYQLITEEGYRVLSIQIQELDDAESEEAPGYIAILTVPLGVHLPSGLRIQVDQRDPVDLSYERCDQGGCYAGTSMGEALTDSLKRGKECVVLFNNLNGNTVRATVSLDGFTAGYNALGG